MATTSNNANNYVAQKSRGLKRKWDVIQERGGKCEICGYNKNISALEFHHKDPKQKDFNLDVRTFSNSKLKSLKLELNKCLLLCANCHREEHNPDLEITNIPLLLTNNTKLSFTTISGDVCPVCQKRFKKITRKKYCSTECRHISEGYSKYPTIDEINDQLKILKSKTKVAEYFGISRKILYGIIK